MKVPIAPCKDCPDRHLHCHSECEKYIQFVKDKKIYDDFVYKQKLANQDLRSYEINKIKRKK